MTHPQSHPEAQGLSADRLTLCDREPIHLPGAIQPHGLLLCLAEPALTILQLSQNLADHTGRPAQDSLGADIASVIGDAGRQQLQRALESTQLQGRPYYVGLTRIGEARFESVLHRYDGQLILELEPTDHRSPSTFTAMYPLVRSFVASLQDTDSLIGLCELAAKEMRRITGFGRVLVYCFDDEGHGRVLAESREPDYSSYLGLHFPASDIPQQARALYRMNHIRLIADANYRPVPLLPALNPSTGRATDLSHASLRSVSPVHVQYMKNMGTLSSMSISIIVRGQLWGLISCHHAQAHVASFEVRTACEHLGQILSLQIEAKQDRSEAEHSLALRRMLVGLLSSMADGENFVDGLASAPAQLLRFAEAGGAAIVSGGRCVRVGDAPPEPMILRLVDWLATQGDRGMVFASSCLAQDYPDADTLQPAAAGLLAVAISQIHQHYVIWFRPEVVQTVNWAGNPNKPMGEADHHPQHPAQLHPRSSFETWSQTVRGKSLPWRSSEIETAQEFRNAVLAVVLRRAEELAALSSELQRANKELEAFSYSVSHDLRAPLRHIVGYADLLRELEGAKLTERGQRFLVNIEESAHFAGTLVDNLLSFSQMGRAALHMSATSLDDLLARAMRDLRSDIEGRDIQWSIGKLPSVVADPTFLQLALGNLLSNAVKYSRSRSPAVIEIWAEDGGESHIVHIRDNGVGFNNQYVAKLFKVFQRLHRMEDFEGTGIGLANVRRIIDRHDGSVWAHGEIDQGATFSFSLPKQPKS